MGAGMTTVGCGGRTITLKYETKEDGCYFPTFFSVKNPAGDIQTLIKQVRVGPKSSCPIRELDINDLLGNGFQIREAAVKTWSPIVPVPSLPVFEKEQEKRLSILLKSIGIDVGAVGPSSVSGKIAGLLVYHKEGDLAAYSFYHTLSRLLEKVARQEEIRLDTSMRSVPHLLKALPRVEASEVIDEQLSQGEREDLRATVKLSLADLSLGPEIRRRVLEVVSTGWSPDLWNDIPMLPVSTADEETKKKHFIALFRCGVEVPPAVRELTPVILTSASTLIPVSVTLLAPSTFTREFTVETGPDTSPVVAHTALPADTVNTVPSTPPTAAIGPLVSSVNVLPLTALVLIVLFVNV